MTPKEKPLTTERFFFWHSGWGVERRFAPTNPSVRELRHGKTTVFPTPFPFKSHPQNVLTAHKGRLKHLRGGWDLNPRSLP